MKNNRRYAGITDNNGKQIFEGDILKATVWNNGDLLTFPAVVEYTDGVFKLKSLASPAVYNFCSICKTRSEVIDNIYDVSPDPLWCEDCKHFKAFPFDMGGEGECDIDKHDTWYGCPICEKYEEKGVIPNDA